MTCIYPVKTDIIGTSLHQQTLPHSNPIYLRPASFFQNTKAKGVVKKSVRKCKANENDAIVDIIQLTNKLSTNPGDIPLNS